MSRSLSVSKSVAGFDSEITEVDPTMHLTVASLRPISTLASSLAQVRVNRLRSMSTVLPLSDLDAPSDPAMPATTNNFTMDISFDLGLELADGTRVLDGVKGEIRHGRLTAIMGPRCVGSSWQITRGPIC